MASCLLTDGAIHREICQWVAEYVPTSVKVSSESINFGVDTRITIEAAGRIAHIEIDEAARLLSLHAFEEQYRSGVMEALVHPIWAEHLGVAK